MTNLFGCVKYFGFTNNINWILSRLNFDYACLVALSFWILIGQIYTDGLTKDK